MRVFWVFGALLFTPFLTGVSQEHGHAGPPGQLNPEGVRVTARPTESDRDKHGDKRCRYRETPGHDRGHSQEAPGIVKKDKPVNTNKHDEECAPTTPPTPPPATTPPPPLTGIAEIHGAVYLDSDANGVMDFYDVGQAGWTVTLSGTLTATTTTDASGDYAFTTLPGGTYTVCEVPQTGYTQTQPSGGGCYSFDIPANMAVWEVNITFGNSQP